MHSISKFIKRSVTSDCQPKLHILSASFAKTTLRCENGYTCHSQWQARESERDRMFALTMKAELVQATCPSKGGGEKAAHGLVMT